MYDKLVSNPKKLFLVDGLGAFLTAFMLGIVLPRLPEYVGMPRDFLSPLSTVACVFGTYSLACHFFAGRNWRPFLLGIVVANFLYCCVTVVLFVLCFDSLKFVDMVYFPGEIMVISVLIYLELTAVFKNGHQAKQKDARD